MQENDSSKDIFPKSEIQKHSFHTQRMNKIYSIDNGNRFLGGCRFCNACCFDEVWKHYKDCKSIPEKDREELLYIYKDMIACAEKDWKDFVERKFEPHSFRKRWENIVCPFCEKFCKNIYHSFVCSATPRYRRETNKKIVFWNGS